MRARLSAVKKFNRRTLFLGKWLLRSATHSAEVTIQLFKLVIYQFCLLLQFPNILYLYVIIGSIISTNTVLTAAHCLDGNFLNLVITAGDHKRSDTTGREQRITACSSLAECRNAFKQHPNWNPNTFAGDLALIYLPEPLTINGKYIPNFHNFHSL